MKTKPLLLLALFAMSVCGQYDNSTMTEPYRNLYYGNIVQAIHTSYTGVWGNWFWLILILGPYFMLYIYQGYRMSIASIWLLSTLATYEYLIEGMTQGFIFWAVIVVWITSIIIRAVSPVYHD